MRRQPAILTNRRCNREWYDESWQRYHRTYQGEEMFAELGKRLGEIGSKVIKPQIE